MKSILLYACILLHSASTFLACAATTNDINPGQTISDHIEVAEMDVFRFDATAGDSVTIAMGRVDGDLHPLIEVWAPNGVLETSAGGSSYFAYLQAHRLTNSGTYLLVCRDDDQVDAGRYNVTLIKNPGPNLSDTSETNTIAAGETRSGFIDVADLDVLEFTAVAGDSVTISMARVDGLLHPLIEVWAPNGVLEAQAGGACYFAYLSAHRLTNSGTYLLVCRDDDQVDPGSYNVTLIRNPGEADIIAPGQTRSGFIDVADLDVLEFTAVAGDSVTISMARVDGLLHPLIEVWAPNGLLEASAGGSSYFAYLQAHRITNSGTYLLVCRDDDQVDAGRYNITLIRNPGSNLSDTGETNTIVAGETRSGFIDVADLDVLEITATAGDLVTIAVGRVDGLVHPLIEVWAPNGVLETSAGGASYFAYLQAHRLTNSGTYLLVCRDDDHVDAGSYNVTLIKNPGPNLSDTSETNTIAAGETRSGFLVASDLDVFEFDGIAGDSVTARIVGAGSVQAQVDLWAPNGTLISGTAGMVKSECLEQSGPYLLVCRDDDVANNGSYTLSLLQHGGPPPTNAPPHYLQSIPCSNMLLVRWSTNAVGFRLQCTERLAEPASPGIWSNIPPPYGGFGGFYFVTNTISPGTKFFRLINP